MANQGFVQELNLAEVTDGEEIIANLAGGTAADDLKVFRGLSSEKSLLFFNRFIDDAVTEESTKSIELGTKFTFDTVYNYTDDDVVEIQPINLIEDFAYEYVGFEGDGVEWVVVPAVEVWLEEKLCAGDSHHSLDDDDLLVWQGVVRVETA